MGKQLENMENKIVQRSVGFNFYQIRFFNKYPEFRPDIFCRKVINDQIKLIAPEFLDNDD